MDTIAELERVVAAGAVRRDDATLVAYGADSTECAEGRPDAVVSVTTRAELIAVVRLAAARGVPLTPRVAGTNLGGLAIPSRGGWLLDLSPMQGLEVLPDDMVALIEPGVSFAQLKAAIEPHGLTIGFPLAPPEVSVMANCLLDGLGNLSLRHGTMSEWIAGLEVVRADGTTLVTGAGALGVPVPFSRAPLPDLTGLFVSMQGSTGIVSRMAVQLWPLPRFRQRSFVLVWDRAAAVRAIREVPRLDLLDDMGALSWPTGKLLLGVDHPTERDPDEPEMFVYLDASAPSQKLLDLKTEELRRWFRALRKDGHRLEDPIDIPTLVAIEPRLGKFAEFPTRLDFLLDHPGGGLTWVGTYGPMSRFQEATDAGCAISERHGFPPTIVARPMKGGHFGVLRFIELFDRRDPADVERVRRCHAELCDALVERGFVMYKTPAWAVERYAPRLDPGFVRLLDEVRHVLDPASILNPGRWQVPR
jgi:FAD/FMN-containing dehydrogenase